MPKEPDALTTTAFGAWLKETRQRKGWSQPILAAKADTTPATISRYETGERPGSKKMALRLAEALEADPKTALAALMLDTTGVKATSPRNDPPRIYPGLEIIVDLRDGPRRGTVNEKTLRAIAELLDNPDAFEEDSEDKGGGE